MIGDYFRLAVDSIRHRQLRSWLTILGIVIGISLVVTMISLGEGMKGAVSQQLSRFGPDTLVVFPGKEANLFSGFFGGLHLEDDDVDVVKNTKGVDIAFPVLIKTIRIEFGDKDKQTLLHGLPSKESEKFLKDFQGWELADGRWFRDKSNEIVIGFKLAKEGFKEDDKGKEIRLNQKVEIDGEKFTVVGIIASLGEREHDFAGYISLDKLRDIIGSSEKEVTNIDIKAAPGVDPNEVAERIKKNLKRSRDAEDFAVLTSERMGNIAGNIIAVIEVVLLGLAVIALVVGGIGIMNTMYTGVLERTKEIGVMKAIGARNRDIGLIFLMEAGIIGLVGGSIGLAIGVSIAKIVEFIAHQNGLSLLSAYINIWLILFGLGFSFVIGCIAGILPAMQASKLKPVDAVRYE